MELAVVELVVVAAGSGVGGVDAGNGVGGGGVGVVA